MDLGIKNKVALVTGAGRGIGRAIAVNLAQEGVKVVAVSRTAEHLAELMKELGGRAQGHYEIACDLMQEGAPERAVREAQKHVGDIDIVVNNVGDTLGVMDPFCPISDWRRVFRVNMEIAIEFNNLVIPAMREKKWGRIVNIASTASLENNGPITYCSAKAALLAYSRSLGRVLAPTGIVLSSVIPGAIFTKGGDWDKKMKERPEHVERYIKERLPLQKFGDPEEISGMVVFLCSGLASFCQGAIVPVDGAQSRHYFGTYTIGD
jgi:3-oxoacyl-[acyl-carrier protein] reductase